MNVKILFILNILFIACQHKKEEVQDDFGTPKIINIDNSIIDSFYDATNIIERIEVLPLKEVSGSYIAEASKILKYNNVYIIFDNNRAKKINAYDLTGNFIKCVSKVGDSPEDALNINDCWINDDNILEIYDYAQMKVYQYDTSLKLIRTKKSKIFNHYGSFSAIPNSKSYVGYAPFNQYNKLINGKSYHIELLDSSLKPFQGGLFFSDKLKGVNFTAFYNHFYPFKDTIRFIRHLDKYIYNVFPKSIKKSYAIEYKINPLPENVTDTISEHLSEFKDAKVMPVQLSLYFKKFTHFVDPLVENENTIFLKSIQNVNGKSDFFLSVVDKFSLKSKNIKRIVVNSKYNMTLPLADIYDYPTKSFISVVQGNHLKMYLNPKSFFITQ